MGRRHHREGQGSRVPDASEFERSLAAAEQDEVFSTGEEPGDDARCTCGSNELLLEAYVRIVDGRPTPEFVEVETLTCPQCGREYEAVQTEDGRILRGEFIGNVELGDDDEG